MPPHTPRRIAAALCAVTAFLIADVANAQEKDIFSWRLEAQEMLASGKTHAALFIMESVADHLNESGDPFEQTQQLRYLGELYQQAGKPQLAAQYFAEALRRSFEVSPSWKQLSAVVGVLEMHRKAFPQHQGLAVFLQQILNKKLLTAVSVDSQAREIGRLVQCFDGAATPVQILQLMHELREIDVPWLRKHALFALTKVAAVPDGTGLRSVTTPNAHLDADDEEKFLWEFQLAKLHAGTGSAQFRGYMESARNLADRMAPEERAKYLRLLGTLSSH